VLNAARPVDKKEPPGVWKIAGLRKRTGIRESTQLRLVSTPSLTSGELQDFRIAVYSGGKIVWESSASPATLASLNAKRLRPGVVALDGKDAATVMLFYGR